MIFTNNSILQIAMQQSAVDANCDAKDFMRSENIIVTSAANPVIWFPTETILLLPYVKNTDH